MLRFFRNIRRRLLDSGIASQRDGLSVVVAKIFFYHKTRAVRYGLSHSTMANIYTKNHIPDINHT